MEVRLGLDTFGDGLNVRRIEAVLARGAGSRRKVTKSLGKARRDLSSQEIDTHRLSKV